MAVMPLPKSLWTMLDEKVQQMLMVWASGVVELAGAKVVVAEQFDPQPDAMPLILVRSYEANYEEGEAQFGDGAGQYHISEITYPYEVVVAANFNTIALAKDFTQGVATGVRDTFRRDPSIYGVQAVDGEHVLRFEFGAAELYVRGLAGAYPEGQYMGTCAITFNFYSEV